MPTPLTELPCRALLATPAGDAPAGAVIVLHEWWGLNAQIAAFLDQLAAEGWLALGLDLYEGEVATEPAQAMALSNRMQTADAIERVRAAQAWLAAHPRSNGRVGLTGFCLGGAITLAAACHVPGLAAAAPFYGLPLPRFADFSRLQAAVQGHYGLHDPILANERVDALEQALQAAGARAQIFRYDAGHAFMREGDPAAFVPEAAASARARLFAFLHAELDG